MQIKLCRNTIIIERAWDTGTLTYIIRELSLLLRELGYELVLDFEGSPIVGGEGIVVEIKLSRDLAEQDLGVLKRVLESVTSNVFMCQ